VTRDEARALLARLLHGIAPEADVLDVDDSALFQDELDLDSVDFLNLVSALHDAIGIDVPEHDYPDLSSVGGFIDYVTRPPGVRGAIAGHRLQFADGQTVEVRPVTRSDIDGLARLYEELDPDSRYRRFFSAWRPSRSFLERLTTIVERGGAGVVAIAYGDDGAEELVGEASYALLPNGDGELGITVADAWRGWLGHYLFDALLDAARAAGVPNLEAEVLVVNGPMLALARTRGCVTMAHPDWGVVRVLVGTSAAPPSWPGRHERTRLLVEGAGGRWHGEEEARMAGLDVLTCPGPLERPRCPMLAGQPCPLAAAADAIVLSRPSEDPAWRTVVDGHGRFHPGVPVCVELAANASASDETAHVPAGTDARGTVAFVQRLVQTSSGARRADDDD
jgi:acyl carrier protein/RimJ/RimL family protein N-acetyltransferase